MADIELVVEDGQVVLEVGTGGILAAERAEASAELVELALVLIADINSVVPWFDTKAAATAALAGLSEGALIGVLVDEDTEDQRTLYRVVSGALVFQIVAGRPVASQAEAEGQASNTKDMTPLRTAQWAAAVLANALLLSGLDGDADEIPYFSAAGAMALATFTAPARTLVGQATQALMRTTGLGMSANGSSLVSAVDYTAMKVLLGLTIGTDVQAADPDLAAIAANFTNGFWSHTDIGTGAARTLTGTAGQVQVTNGAGVAGNPVFSLLGNALALSNLSLVADRLPWADGTGTMALATFTAFARSLIDDADAKAARATLLANRAAVADMAALTALTKATLTTGDLVRARLASGAYDGGGGDYSWDAASTATVDGGTVLASDEGGDGRWTMRAGVEMVDVRNFLVNPGQSAAVNATNLQKAISACYGKNLIIPFPGGVVTYDTGVVIDPANANNNGIMISGAGGHGNAGAALKYTGTGSAAINFTGASTTGVANGDNRPLVFKGFTLYGPDTGAAGPNGFSLFGANGQTLFEDMWVYGFGDSNIYMEQCFGAEMNRVLSNTPRKNGIYLKDSANNVVLRHVRSFGAGRAIGVGDCSNIRISGALDSYGVVLDACDFSYAGGNTFARSVANGGITQIVVAGSTGTITFAAAHGMSVGNTFGIVGGTLRDINGYKAASAVPTPTTVECYMPTADGTYNNAELTITAPAIGLLLSNCNGVLINGWYCETSPQSAYIIGVKGLTINGGEQLSAKMVLETDVEKVKINGLHSHGVASTIEFYGTGENKVDVSMTCSFEAGASLILPTVYQRDGQYFSTAAPAAGAWTAGTVVWNTAPAAAASPGWVCVASGSPGTWKGMAILLP